MTRLIAMLDYETLGLAVNCPLISVGMAIVDLHTTTFEVKADIYRRIAFNETNPAIFDPKTLWWWMQQSEEARACFNPEGATELETALAHLFSFYRMHRPTEVWSKGADFDIAITKHRAEQFKLELPWNYKDQRCYRTLEAMFPNEMVVPKSDVKHNALEDAVLQAQKLWTVTQLTGQAKLN